MQRVCVACREVFEFEYSRGRPREYCLVCQPLETRRLGAVKVMDDSPDLRPALAYLKAVAAGDSEGIQVLLDHGDTLELVDGLADLLLLFIEDLADDPARHVDLMFRAYDTAQRGIQE